MLTLVSSRNNYNLLEDFFLKKNGIPFSNIINADAGSTSQNKSIGKKLCKKHGMHYFETESTALQEVIAETIIKYRSNSKSKWLLFIHSDAYLTSNNYNKLISKLNNKLFNQFGLVGLNTVFWPHTKRFEEINQDQFYFGLMGKSILADTNFNVYGPHTIKNLDDQKDWNNLVCVEAVMDIGLVVNMDLFLKYIKPTDKIPFICALDDVAMQFLNSSIYNVTIPDVHCVHDPWIKKKFNMPVSSPKALYNKFNKDFYNDDLSFEKEWIRKWKFDRQYKNIIKKPIVRNNFFKRFYTFINNIMRPNKVILDQEIKDLYKNSLIGDFMNHSSDRPFLFFSD